MMTALVDEKNDSTFVGTMAPRCPDNMVSVCVHFPRFSQYPMYFKFHYGHDRAVVVLRAARLHLNAEACTPFALMLYFWEPGIKACGALVPLHVQLSHFVIGLPFVLHFAYV